MSSRRPWRSKCRGFENFPNSFSLHLIVDIMDTPRPGRTYVDERVLLPVMVWLAITVPW